MGGGQQEGPARSRASSTCASVIRSRSTIGAGGDSRLPLGLSVCGGLIFSQFVTLLITPVIYTYFDDFARWTGRGRHADPAQGTTPAA